MIRQAIPLLLFLLLPLFATAQNARLAQQYYADGEYEKAAQLYQQLFEQNERNDYYFDRYVESLLNLERFDEAEQAISKQLRKDPDNARLYVSRGQLHERQYEDEKAKELYQEAIKRLPRNKYAITKLANLFTVQNKYEFAIATYERGEELLKEQGIFAFNLGELYRRKGETEKMLSNYLNSLAANPDRISTLQTIFQRYLTTEEEYQELQKQLYARIQDNQDALFYPELLTWVFIQQKDYKSALRQVRALDRRLQENGQRVYQLAEIAANDKDYNVAIDAFDYIVESKGPSSSYYLDAQREALRNRRLKLVQGFDYSKEDLITLEQQYEGFLNEFGKTKLTAGIILELAELEALYLNNLPKATQLLAEMVEYPDVNPWLLARAKLNLADYYLMQGERWEATLLYSQVDKGFKDDLLGQEARFRNARLSYYAGDFQWAQSQFDVLKASTSKLIANDALDLSVFIMDNLGLDSTATPLEMYAEADLLVFQNRFDEAFNTVDKLISTYPDHSLQDDVYYLKAQVYKKQRNYAAAAEMLQKIIDNFSDGIRADNAIFMLAELYQNQLNDQEKAMQLYETLFIDFSNSTFAVEARKRFRQLRGDNI